MRRWPPRAGDLWVAVDRWPPTLSDPGINGGEVLMVLQGEDMKTPDGAVDWWHGEVLAPAGKRFIKAVPEDLIPLDESCNRMLGMI